MIDVSNWLTPALAWSAADAALASAHPSRSTTPFTIFHTPVSTSARGLILRTTKPQNMLFYGAGTSGNAVSDAFVQPFPELESVISRDTRFFNPFELRLIGTRPNHAFFTGYTTGAGRSFDDDSTDGFIWIMIYTAPVSSALEGGNQWSHRFLLPAIVQIDTSSFSYTSLHARRGVSRTSQITGYASNKNLSLIHI